MLLMESPRPFFISVPITCRHFAWQVTGATENPYKRVGLSVPNKSFENEKVTFSCIYHYFPGWFFPAIQPGQWFRDNLFLPAELYRLPGQRPIYELLCLLPARQFLRILVGIRYLRMWMWINWNIRKYYLIPKQIWRIYDLPGEE